VVLAEIKTGVAKFAVCHPLALSPPKVTVPSSVPSLAQRWPTCVPVLPAPL